MRWRWLLSCALLPACLTPTLTPCGDLLCADGAVCVADTVCAFPEQLEACSGLAEEMACNSTFGPGHCVSGVCVANVCGDGVITGVEGCDGEALDATCASFGRYEGQVTCSPSCVPDPSGCTGYCGDGTVQAQFDEQCDTAPPAEGCLDFGQDYGVLTCNAFCAPAITRDCQRYRWDVVLSDATTYTAVAGNARGVIGLHAGGIDIVWDGVSSTRANPGWTSVVANTTILVAIGASSLGWFDGQWHEVQAGVTAMTWLTLADDGALFVRTGSQCDIVHVNVTTGATASVLVPPVALCDSGVALAANRLFVPQGADGVRMWNGFAWSLATATPVGTLLVLPISADRVALQTLTQTYYADVSGASLALDSVWFGGVGNIRMCVHDIDGNEVCLSSENEVTELSLELRAHQARFVSEDLSAAEKSGITRTADGRVIVFGRGARVMAPQAIATPLTFEPQVLALYRAEDGLIGCGGEVFITGLAGFVQRPWIPDTHDYCLELAGSALGMHFARNGVAVLRYNVGNNAYELFASGNYTSIAGDFTQLWITAATGLTSFTSGNAASATNASHPAGCVITELAMSPSRTFVGAGQCGGKLGVFAVSGTTWTTLATSTIDATSLELEIADDDTIFVRNTNDVYRVDGTVFTPVGTGQGVEAISADNFFIDQGGETMLHINGTRTQEIRLSSGPFVATPTHLFAWDRISRRVKAVALLPSRPDGP